jgi:Tol biopolymer transport system component
MDPYIAPDESFIIFASNRPNGISEADMFLRDGGSQELDLYISYNKGNNTWTTPKNLGKGINTKAWEFGPTLSPDKKYLFFTRRMNFKTVEPSKIYWVSAIIIDQLKD